MPDDLFSGGAEAATSVLASASLGKGYPARIEEEVFEDPNAADLAICRAFLAVLSSSLGGSFWPPHPAGWGCYGSV